MGCASAAQVALKEDRAGVQKRNGDTVTFRHAVGKNSRAWTDRTDAISAARSRVTVTTDSECWWAACSMCLTLDKTEKACESL